VAEREIGFSEAFSEAGGVRRRQPVPYPLTHASIRGMCAKRERLLRIQFEDERFSDEDEEALAGLSLDDPDQAFERYLLIVGLWHAWQRGLGARGSQDRDATRWMVLAREPVYVRVAGRTVGVTSRSRAAMIRLHRHEAARSLLGEKLDLIEARIAAVDEARAGGRTGWWRAIGRKRRLQALAARVESEWELHFRGVLANALTPDGRAALPDDAPDWWDQVTAEDEARILVALLEAGPVRFDAAKKPAKPQSGSDKDGPITFSELLRMWEPKLHLPPMALDDQDLAQLLVALEEGASKGAEAQELEEAFG
jgi:hypothetical protein